MKNNIVLAKVSCFTFRQVTFIYIVLFTIQIVSKQLNSNNRKITKFASVDQTVMYHPAQLSSNEVVIYIMFVNVLHAVMYILCLCKRVQK